MGGQPEHNFASIKIKFKTCSVLLFSCRGMMTGVVNTPKGVDLCRRTVNTHVGLAVVVTVQDGGGVSELELVDIQCNIQMLRGTESE